MCSCIVSQVLYIIFLPLVSKLSRFRKIRVNSDLNVHFNVHYLTVNHTSDNYQAIIWFTLCFLIEGFMVAVPPQTKDRGNRCPALHFLCLRNQWTLTSGPIVCFQTSESSHENMAFCIPNMLNKMS